MKIVRDMNTFRVLYRFSDGENVEITDHGLTADSVRALDIRPTTHEIVTDVPEHPCPFVGGALAFDGAWSIVDADAIAAVVAVQTAELIASYTAALDAHIDSVAQSDRWDNRITCIARAGYPNVWQAKAIAFGVWMDTCYGLAYEIMYNVQAGIAPLPSLTDFIGGMPTMVWPE